MNPDEWPMDVSSTWVRPDPDAGRPKPGVVVWAGGRRYWFPRGWGGDFFAVLMCTVPGAVCRGFDSAAEAESWRPGETASDER